MSKKAKCPFPHKSKLAANAACASPMLPLNIDIQEKITALLKQILLNDLIIDENSPAEKNKFRMVFRHCQKWDTDEGTIDVSHITTSESHGYGMMILAFMAGSEKALGLLPEQWLCGCGCLQDYYDAMLRTVLAFPSVLKKNSRLFAWELFGYPAEKKNKTGYKKINGIKKAPFTRDPNRGDCATDGDMDIIYSLLLADKQWESKNYNYKQTALDMLDDLWDCCVHKKYFTLLLGDWAAESKGALAGAVRISDIIPAHLKVYSQVDKKHDWQKVLDATYNVINDLCANKKTANGLLPDFAVWKDGKWRAPKKTILEGDDGAYSYNACRVPWRLGSDYLLYGDTVIGNSSLYNLIIKPLDEFAANFTNGDLELLGALTLDGALIDENDPDTFAAPFLVTAAANKASQDWVNKLWKWKGLNKYNGDNYGDYVKLLSMLTAAGSTWLPLYNID